MTARPTSVAIAGLGAIGGSLALALRESGVAVVGFAGREDCALATRAGVLVAQTLASAVRGAGLVVLAVPTGVVREAASVVRTLTDVPVLHVASVQRAASLGFAPDDWVPLGTHPIAGTHRSGFAAADKGMFRGARVSIEARATTAERRTAEWLWTAVGAGRVEYRDAAAHDRQMAWVSHLPQLASVALASAVMRGGESPSALGPGGRDGTRLAASGFSMWRDILGANADEVAPALECLERELRALREAIAAGEPDRIRDAWERARVWREGRRSGA